MKKVKICIWLRRSWILPTKPVRKPLSWRRLSLRTSCQNGVRFGFNFSSYWDLEYNNSRSEFTTVPLFGGRFSTLLLVQNYQVYAEVYLHKQGPLINFQASKTRTDANVDQHPQNGFECRRKCPFSRRAGHTLTSKIIMLHERWETCSVRCVNILQLRISKGYLPANKQLLQHFAHL